MTWITLFVIFSSITAVSLEFPVGKGVCSKLQEVKVTKVVSSLGTYERRYTTWCFSIPPRCTRYRAWPAEF
ncbi:hypothetical protein TNCT_398521 [Trichonephila clavata]|uniref:Uncharacterized protein n=1 Tax=Trichonephila clavata TaxID=2740835 RepID=A0A8X6LCS7_TRICU|nr:hypothetical protein TNCT_398521 [Trichonephila clavata]